MKVNLALIIGALVFALLFMFIIAKPIEYPHSAYSRSEVGNENSTGDSETRSNVTIIVTSILFGVLLASVALGIYQSNKFKMPKVQKKS